MPHTVDGVTFTVPLALVDFLPVLFGLLGVLVLAGMAGRAVPAVRPWAYSGAVLIGLGGLCKSTWKLLVAWPDIDVGWLDGMLFALLGPGFALLAWSLLSYRLGRPARWWPYLSLVLVCAGTALLGRSTAPMLALTAIFSLTLSSYGLLTAWQRRVRLGALLFGLAILASLMLVPLGSPDREQTVPLQWVEEGVNTAGQAAFLFAALLLARSTRDRVTPAAAPETADLRPRRRHG
jgi:hypothetical protein